MTDKKKTVYVGVPTELISNILTSRGLSEDALKEGENLNVLAVDVQGELSIALCELSRRTLQ